VTQPKLDLSLYAATFIAQGERAVPSVWSVTTRMNCVHSERWDQRLFADYSTVPAVDERGVGPFRWL
jgi:hypothetical protein